MGRISFIFVKYLKIRGKLMVERVEKRRCETEEYHCSLKVEETIFDNCGSEENIREIIRMSGIFLRFIGR